MEKNISSINHEVRPPSDEDEMVGSSTYPRQINPSTLPEFHISSKSWTGPAKIHEWTSLANCMKFIEENGCAIDQQFTWVQNILNGVSYTATPGQLSHILNGYADLHGVLINYIPVTSNTSINYDDTELFAGTLNNEKQQKRLRNRVFIMHNLQKSSFAPLYVSGNNSLPQICFAEVDIVIISHSADLVSILNLNTSQQIATENDHSVANNDATSDIDDLQMTHSLNVPPSLSLAVQNEDNVAVSKTNEKEIQHKSQIVTRSDHHSDYVELIPNAMANTPHQSSETEWVDKVFQNFDNVEEYLVQARPQLEVADVLSMETDGRQVSKNDGSKEGKLISKSVMVKTTPDGNILTRTNTHLSKEKPSDTYLCLSQTTTKPAPVEILTDSNETINRFQKQYGPPDVKRHPKHHRRIRMLKDVAKKQSPLVQAGDGKTQRIYPEIEVPDENDERELYVRVRAVTENHHDHPLQCVAPEEAHVDLSLATDNNERICLQCDPDSFDPTDKCVFLAITTLERRERRKQIKVHLFNWKQCEETNKEIIEKENLRLCRLEFSLCTRLNTGHYQLVSEPSYSSVIEGVDGDVHIDPREVEPKQLCELGGEKIVVPLSTLCRKKDFHVEYNGKKIKINDFTMERKKLILTSPRKVDGIDELHLIISREEYDQNSSDRHMNKLYEDFLPYVSHGQCTHYLPRL